VTVFGAGASFRSGWRDVRAVFDWVATDSGCWSHHPTAYEIFDLTGRAERDVRSVFTYEAILIEMGEEPLTGM
jgi:hypothetical protein